MTTIIDPKALCAEMQKAEWERSECGDGEVRRVFLGTVMGLTPSGKYYTPFANSNVEVCEKCSDGCGDANDRAHCGDDSCDGSCCEAHADAVWWNTLDKQLDAIGLASESGEGDPCDIFATEYRDGAQRGVEGFAVFIPNDMTDFPNNKDRAGFADATLRYFNELVGGDEENMLCDLLADLLHWADASADGGTSFEGQLDRARQHYEAEVEDEAAE